jgi:hypothetical protein
MTNDVMKSLVTKDNFLNSGEQEKLSYAPLIIEIQSTKLMVAARKWGGSVVGEERLVGFGVLTAVVINITKFWDITPISVFKVNRRFYVGACRLHLQD